MPQRTVVSCCLALFGVLAAPVVQAQGFSAFVTSPRFELQVQPGERLRQVLEIQHAGGQTGRFRVYTNDWRFRPDQTVEFSDALSPGSCRPWVAVERRELSIEPGARFRYRFEITVPPGTPPGECRFALMVEGADAAQVEGTLNFPVGGRIAVIVYAAIGGAAPRLSAAYSRVRLIVICTSIAAKGATIIATRMPMKPGASPHCGMKTVAAPSASCLMARVAATSSVRSK